MLKLFENFRRGCFFLLSPFLVMVLFSVGRGLGNTSLLLYFLAGLFLIPEIIKRKDFGLYAFAVYSILFLATFLINSDDLTPKSVIVFWLSSLAYVYASSINEFKMDEKSKNMLISVLGIGLLAVIFDYMAFFYDSEFRASTFVNVMVLAVIFPVAFLLDDRKIRFMVIGMMSALIALSDSRTEILAIAISVIFYFCFVFRKMLFMVAGMLLALVSTVFFIFNSYVNDGQYDTLIKVLSKISSKRTDLWMAALQSPPENILLGGGLGNSAHVIMQYNPKHLHNLFIEMYWEVGVLGALAILALSVYVLSYLVKSYRYLEGGERNMVSVLGACYISLVIVCCLDKGFNTVFFSFFYFAILGVIFSVCKGFLNRRTMDFSSEAGTGKGDLKRSNV